MNCKQKNGEPFHSYLQKLKLLSVDCTYQAVSAEKCREEAIRDDSIGGIYSSEIRQRLLGDNNLTLLTSYDKACSRETA